MKFLKELGIKDLGEAVSTFEHQEENGALKHSTCLMESTFRGSPVKVFGYAFVHKDDEDFSTKRVGENISETRAAINLIRFILNGFALDKEDLDKLASAEKVLQKEVEDYIQLKDDFFNRVRMKRKDPNYNRIRVINVDDEGKATEING